MHPPSVAPGRDQPEMPQHAQLLRDRVGREPGPRGEPVFDDSFVIAFNASEKNLKFTIPDEVYGEGWVVVLDTHDDEAGSVSFFDDAVPFLPGLEFEVAARSAVLLRKPRKS